MVSLPSRREPSALSLAVRRNRGARISPKFRNDLAAVLRMAPEDLVFLDLVTSDASFERVMHRRQELERGAASADVVVSMRARSENVIEHGLQALLQTLAGSRLILHRALSELCGAVEVEASRLIARAFDLVELDQESLVAGDRAGDRGVVLDYVTDPIGFGVPTFLLVGWTCHRDDERT